MLSALQPSLHLYLHINHLYIRTDRSDPSPPPWRWFKTIFSPFGKSASGTIDRLLGVGGFGSHKRGVVWIPRPNSALCQSINRCSLNEDFRLSFQILALKGNFDHALMSICCNFYVKRGENIVGCRVPTVSGIILCVGLGVVCLTCTHRAARCVLAQSLNIP